MTLVGKSDILSPMTTGTTGTTEQNPFLLKNPYLYIEVTDGRRIKCWIGSVGKGDNKLAEAHVAREAARVWAVPLDAITTHLTRRVPTPRFERIFRMMAEGQWKGWGQ